MPVLAAPPPHVVVLGHAIAGVAPGTSRAALTAGLGKGPVLRSRRLPDPAGVAIGSTEARMRAAYGRRLHCGNFQIRTLGEALPGHALTTFDLTRARASRIDVSAVLD